MWVIDWTLTVQNYSSILAKKRTVRFSDFMFNLQFIKIKTLKDFI